MEWHVQQAHVHNPDDTSGEISSKLPEIPLSDQNSPLSDRGMRAQTWKWWSKPSISIAILRSLKSPYILIYTSQHSCLPVGADWFLLPRASIHPKVRYRTRNFHIRTRNTRLIYRFLFTILYVLPFLAFGIFCATFSTESGSWPFEDRIRSVPLYSNVLPFFLLLLWHLRSPPIIPFPAPVIFRSIARFLIAVFNVLHNFYFCYGATFYEKCLVDIILGT